MTILLFFAVLFVLVLVHELGHFIAAKRTGMRVDEFGIGFPPKVFAIKKGETLYSFNLLPIGGFVRIFGEDGTDVASSPVSDDVRDRRSEASAEADEGGTDAIDADGSSDRERSFVAKSKLSQAIVLVAGVAMNIAFAWLLFTIAFSLGTQTAVTESEASEDATLIISQVLPESPASDAGLRGGVRVVGLSAGDASLDEFTPSAFSTFVSTYGDEELTLTYAAGDTEESVTLSPERYLIESDKSQPAIGVALNLIDVVSRPIHEAAYDSAILTVKGFKDITVAIVGLLYDAVRLEADLTDVAGPVGIVGLVGEASAFGFTALLTFTAFISLNLAVINLLPFPALDGGRLLFVAIETVKGTPINPKIAYALNAGGFMLLILLMIAVTYNDILRIL
jgi:regulator of sigma E protease